jgi:hypothetical protein
MGFLPIAAINMDMIIGIIAVVGWIIAQALSKKGNAAPPARPATTEPGRTLNPNDDLREFFENLEKGLSSQTGQPAQAASPTPPPLPVPAGSRHSAHRPRPVQRLRQTEASLPEPDRVYPPEPSLAGLAVVSPAIAQVETVQRWGRAPHKWAAGFTNPDTLRQMIVANEVLGTPLALRKRIM